jgi:Ion channel
VSARRTNPVRRSFLSRLADGDTYGTLLVLIVVAYLLMAIVEDSKWARTITGLCFGATLLLALHTSHVRGRIIRVATVIVIVLVVWSGILAATDNEPFTGATHLTILLILAAPAVILYRVFRHPVINVETILGAIDAYLLLGISFAAVYLMEEDLDPHFFAQGAASGVKFLYFSFVVITTLGFGDLTPRTDIGRVIVSLEALLGQIFLVTVVAVLVANMGRAVLRPGSAMVVDPAEDLADEQADGLIDPDGD